MASVYIESTIPSYLTSRKSRDPIIGGHQRITEQWWQSSRRDYDLCTSEVELIEIADGDPVAAAERLSAMQDIRLLPAIASIDELALRYQAELEIPERSAADTLHLAYTVVHAIDFLLTWNCAHLANGNLMRKLRILNDSTGLWTPLIVTPESL